MNGKPGKRKERIARKRPAAPQGWLGRGWTLMQRGNSAGWLISTALQAVLTLGFIGLAKLSKGFPWEGQAKLLVIVAIGATWCMALRTIRERLVELWRFGRRASKELLAKAAGRERPPLRAALQAGQILYLRKAMLRLRIIAAGITMPFFVLPIFTAALCAALCWRNGIGDGGLLGLALMGSVFSVTVGAYFHWSILPIPVTARAPTRRIGPARCRN